MTENTDTISSPGREPMSGILVTEKGVEKKLKQLNPKKAPGPDEI
jgi:hypothetical protein